MSKPRFNPIFLGWLMGALVLSSCKPAKTDSTPILGSTLTPVATLTDVATLAPIPTLPPLQVTSRTPARFETTDCTLFNVPENIKTDCGYLLVPEDRNQPDSPLIKLAVVIARSSNPNPSPEPFVFLQGGPGASTINILSDLSILYNTSPLFDVLENHDLIVFDQRGTGFSLPSLNCPEWDSQVYEDISQNLSRKEAQQHSIQAVLACHNRLVQEGRNLAAYTSAANAADVDDLRLALGYAKLNLYGISYGARLALTVMRDFPAGVQSVILDFVYPPQVAGNAERVRNAEHAVNLLFDRCAADTQCNAAYPELKAIFYDTVAQWDTHPITLALTYPTSGLEYAAVLNWG